MGGRARGDDASALLAAPGLHRTALRPPPRGAFPETRLLPFACRRARVLVGADVVIGGVDVLLRAARVVAPLRGEDAGLPAPALGVAEVDVGVGDVLVAEAHAVGRGALVLAPDVSV